MTKKLRKAVFPVAGAGTRFLPATKAIPKEMLTVVDKPLIQYAVDEARAAGIEEFIFVTGRGKAAIEDHFDHAEELRALLASRGKAAELAVLDEMQLPAGAVSYTRQQQPLGLGHAVWCARHLVGDEPFAVLLPDELFLAETPCLSELVEVHAAKGGCVLGLADVPREQTNRYGIVDPGDDDGHLITISGMVEKPAPAEAPSTLSIIGRYVLAPEVFAELGRHRAGVGGEIQLTDSIAALIGAMPFHGVRYKGERYDCGGREGFVQANIAFAMARADLAERLKPFLTNYMRDQ